MPGNRIAGLYFSFQTGEIKSFNEYNNDHKTRKQEEIVLQTDGQRTQL